MDLHIQQSVDVYKEIEMLSFNPMKNYKRFSSIFTHKIFKDRQKKDIKEKQQDAHFDDI